MRIPLLTLVLSLIPARAPAATLEQALAAIDDSARTFREMSAKLTRIDYTAVIKDTSEENASVRMRRNSRGEVSMVVEFGEPDQRTVVFEKAKLQVYYPKMATVQVYDLGKQRALVDQFLLLGFGSSSAELKRSYRIRVAGEEQIGGEPVTRLELTPVAASAKQSLSKAELWIAAAGYPLQQKFSLPSGDYKLITYKGLRINPGLAADAFAPKFPKGVKYEYPQK